MISRNVALLYIALFTQSCFAQFELIQAFEIPRQVDRRKIGYGYDLFTNEVKSGSCLTGAKVGEAYEENPGGRQSAYYLVSDSEQVARAISGSVSGSFSGGFASASASASFTNSFSFESDSTWIVGRKLVPYRVTTLLAASAQSRTSIEGVLFDVRADKIRNIGVNGDALQKFRQECGDGYISSITEGGFLMGKIRVANRSQVEKSTFESSLSGGGLGMSGNASLSATAMQAFTTKSVSTDTIELGSDRVGSPTDIAKFIEYYQNFGLKEGFSPRPVLITVTSYTALPSWPRLSNADLTYIPAAINEALLTRARLIDLEKRYTFVRQHSEDYYNIFYRDWLAFDAEHDRIIEVVNLLGALIRKCSSNLNECRGRSLRPQLVAQRLSDGRGLSSQNSLLTQNISNYARLNVPVDKFGKLPTMAEELAGFDFPKLSRDYYFWRLSIPWQRKPDAAQDELEVFLAKYDFAKLKDSIADEKLSAEELKSLQTKAIEWVLNQRFDVLRSSYCSAVTTMSPLCGVSRGTMAAELQAYFYGKGIRAPAPAAPAERKRTPIVPPVRFPCLGRPGNTICL